MQLFDQEETSAELDELLRKAGIDPHHTRVLKIKTIISAYYARRTANVLERVKEVLDHYTAANSGDSTGT